MLKIITGRAGTGKTAAVVDEIRRSVASGTGKSLFLVPEQYSHEAERELCRVCGDRLSLHAEVMSFSALARRVLSETGGCGGRLLDNGGRLLCMGLALKNVSPALKVYGSRRRTRASESFNVDLQELLLSAVDELRAACIGTEELEQAAARCTDPVLADKLSDMALILSAYDAVLAHGHADPRDRLSLLAERLPQSSITPDTAVYVDGFIDFTVQQRLVLRTLLKMGLPVTVCLTIDPSQPNSEVFALSLAAKRDLEQMAEELHLPVQYEQRQDSHGKDPALALFTDRLFSYGKLPGGPLATDSIHLHSTIDAASECEFAAALCRRLVQETGCRWRDIAIAIRGYGDYREQLEDAFLRYEVPLFETKKVDIMAKPLPLMIYSAYNIVLNGWQADDVITCLRTGFSGLSAEECDLLENYIYRWDLSARAWLSPRDWEKHPDGLGQKDTAASAELLSSINASRRRFAAPLLKLRMSADTAHTAAEHAAALTGFLRELQVPQQLAERARSLTERSAEDDFSLLAATGAEYRQLWKILVSALEQIVALLGDMEMSMEEFARLFVQMLSAYTVGLIPVGLDKVSAGDFDRMRRRSIRHLIILGADETRLPAGGESSGVFTEDERRRLLKEYGLDLGGIGDNDIWREFTLIYNTVSLPSDRLTLVYSSTSPEGAKQEPSFLLRRAQELFDLPLQKEDLIPLRLSARKPAYALAATALRDGSNACAGAALQHFRAADADAMARLEQAGDLSRGSLTPVGAAAIYGDTVNISASKVDTFNSCRFQYFCEHGLKAKPLERAELDARQVGDFYHAVLEHTAKAVRDRGGFRQVSAEELKTISDEGTELWLQKTFGSRDAMAPRDRHLFHRNTRELWSVVHNMARELSNSDFVPLSFELDFREAGLPPFKAGSETAMRLIGIADRVDGWKDGDTLYLRVADYKSGSKHFDFSDVWFGIGMQMLMYLFNLSENGLEYFRKELKDESLSRILPAGVMYVPARDSVNSFPAKPSPDEVEKKKAPAVRCSGVLLGDPALLHAWENSPDLESTRYMPKRNAGRTRKPDTGYLLTEEQMQQLAALVKRRLCDMAEALATGSIEAEPHPHGNSDPCTYCNYAAVCGFKDGENGEHSCKLPKLTSGEFWQMVAEEEEGGGNADA